MSRYLQNGTRKTRKNSLKHLQDTAGGQWDQVSESPEYLPFSNKPESTQQSIKRH